jgi:hypothetical protein
VTPKTARRWAGRDAAAEGLQDRSCRPHFSPTATPPELLAHIEQLRRQRWTSTEIAAKLRLGRSTVARLVARLGLARLKSFEPRPPVQRYERLHPGELLHLDIKKLGRIGGVGHRITGDRRRRARGIGWEYVHVAVDDASRLGYVEVLRDERGPSVAQFLWRALAWFRRHARVVIEERPEARRRREDALEYRLAAIKPVELRRRQPLLRTARPGRGTTRGGRRARDEDQQQ